MSVRAKFRVFRKSQTAYRHPDGSVYISGVEIEAVPVGPNESEENKAFFKASPSGSFKITIDNPPAAGFFELGQDYYLDFTKA